MTVFESLFLGHVLGDWLLQTEWQAENKATNWRALFTHVLIYHIVMFLVLWFVKKPPIADTLIVVGLLGLSHAVLDRQNVVQVLMRVLRLAVHRQPERWLTVAIDQAIHIVLLGGAALFLTK